MNKQEYEKYENSVQRFFDRNGITNLSRIPDSEPSFSYSRCDCCNRPLGGDRINASGYNPTTKEILEFTICEDCEYYAEYGQLDDMTMMDMENAE